MQDRLILRKFSVSTSLYALHANDGEEWDLSAAYRSTDSILESGCDYDWVSSNVAGIVNQIEKTGKAESFGCLPDLGGFSFVSSEILQTYFPHPEKSTIFLAHLFLLQDVLELCSLELQQIHS